MLPAPMTPRVSAVDLGMGNLEALGEVVVIALVSIARWTCREELRFRSRAMAVWATRWVL